MANPTSRTNGHASSDGLHTVWRHHAAVLVRPPLRAAFCLVGSLSHVLEGVSLPQAAIYPISTRDRS